MHTDRPSPTCLNGCHLPSPCSVLELDIASSDHPPVTLNYPEKPSYGLSWMTAYFTNVVSRIDALTLVPERDESMVANGLTWPLCKRDLTRCLI